MEEIKDEIKVGEYIRTTKGWIVKIKNDEHLGFLKFSNAVIGNIKDHKDNIIDLIEVGDIITYNKDFIITSKIVESVGEKCVYVGYPDSIKIYQNELVDILTHEIYNQNCYKIGE